MIDSEEFLKKLEESKYVENIAQFFLIATYAPFEKLIRNRLEKVYNSVVNVIGA